jgi:hypothetical protein
MRKKSRKTTPMTQTSQSSIKIQMTKMTRTTRMIKTTKISNRIQRKLRANPRVKVPNHKVTNSR